MMIGEFRSSSWDLIQMFPTETSVELCLNLVLFLQLEAPFFQSSLANSFSAFSLL